MTLLTPSFCASLLLFTPFFSFSSSSSSSSFSLFFSPSSRPHFSIHLSLPSFHVSKCTILAKIARISIGPLVSATSRSRAGLTPSPLHSNAENRSLLLTTCPLVLIDPEGIAGSLSLLILLRSMTILGARSTPCSTLNCAGSDEN